MSGKRLLGKTALVIGASEERGTGWGIATRFAAEGARTLVAARRLDKLELLADKIGGTAVACDVADEASVLAMVDEIRSTVGSIDLLINSAGQPIPGDFELESAQIHETIAVDLVGTWNLLRHVPAVINDGGAIVGLTSMVATHVMPGFTAYGAAKAASNALLKSAAVSLAPRGIRVNGILPGMIDTPKIDSFRDISEVMEVFVKEVPLRRIGTPEDMAAAAVWLCQDDCFCTGVLLNVDGGLHLRRTPYPEELPAAVFDDVR